MRIDPSFQKEIDYVNIEVKIERLNFKDKIKKKLNETN